MTPEDFVPQVLNQRDFGRALPPHTTYIGRGSPYGNPFVIGVDGDRDAVIDRYIAERSQDPEFIALVKQRLKNRHLCCHCTPKRCHGDWLFEVANSDLMAVEQDEAGKWRFSLTSPIIPLQHSSTT